jgi:RES domain-containing protein
MRIEIPEDLPDEWVPESDLPAAWNEVPDHPSCVRRGDAWAKTASTAVLRVPSAIVPEEENVLINPRHTDAARIAVVHTRAFVFDRPKTRWRSTG